MSVVEGVSLATTGTFATSFTTWVTTEQSFWSLPMLLPMSSRSMWGQDRFSSKPSAPSSWQARARVRQWSSSLSLPDPAMIDAMSTRSGNACLMHRMRGAHQSRVLSEMSSQFHEEWSAPARPLFMERVPVSAFARRNLVFGPATLTTGCSPMVLVTTPPHPASKALMMLLSDSVGGADERRKGFANRIPVKSTERSTLIKHPLQLGVLRTPARACAGPRQRRRIAPFRDAFTAGPYKTVDGDRGCNDGAAFGL